MYGLYIDKYLENIGRSESKLISLASERAAGRGWISLFESSRLWRRAEKKAGGVAARLKSHQTDFDARNARVTLCKPSPLLSSSATVRIFLPALLPRREGRKKNTRSLR